MKKKNYTTPNIIITQLYSVDIIATSPNGVANGDDTTISWDTVFGLDEGGNKEL